MKRTIALVSLTLMLTACDGTEASGPGDALGADATAGDAGVTGADTPDGTPQDAAGAMACGPTTTCVPPQACEALGQGTCGGPAPGPDGKCAPGCSPMECGGGTHCLCGTYKCIDLPPGCTGCDCTWTDWHQSCICDDSTGLVVLQCPGA